jgi:hypothetical protein
MRGLGTSQVDAAGVGVSIILVRIDPRYLRPTEVRHPPRGCLQGQGPARLETPDRFRGAGRGDDRGGPSGGGARSPGEVERLSGLRRRNSRAGMAPGAKVYVAGHGGLLGAALVRCLRAAGFEDLVTRSHAELDLGDAGAVRDFFAGERPEYVFLAAAKVGGILANATYPACRSRPMSSTRPMGRRAAPLVSRLGPRQPGIPRRDFRGPNPP